jgi:hypothetical protein
LCLLLHNPPPCQPAIPTMFTRFSMLASLLFASAALATPISTLTTRAVKPGCQPQGIDESCSTLVKACLFFTGDGNGSQFQLYHQKACIAAATCYGVSHLFFWSIIWGLIIDIKVGNLVNKVSCQVGASVINQEQISLDYNVSLKRHKYMLRRLLTVFS